MLSNVKTKTLNVGRVSFLNTLPFYFQFPNQENIQWQEGTPSYLNQKMRQGELDVALVSSLEYAQAQDQYEVLAPICIGTKNQSDSVVLVSQEPIEKLNGQNIMIPKESLSSSTLLQILLQKQYGFKNSFELCENHITSIFKKSKAGLLIGDAALFEKDRAPFSYDLGVLWREWQAKPFCFALWVVQKKAAQQFTEEVARFKKQLTQSLQYTLYHLDELMDWIRTHRTLDENHMQSVLDYFMHLNFFMDPEMRQGLMTFFKLANELELSPACEALQFFQGEV